MVKRFLKGGGGNVYATMLCVCISGRNFISGYVRQRLCIESSLPWAFCVKVAKCVSEMCPPSSSKSPCCRGIGKYVVVQPEQLPCSSRRALLPHCGHCIPCSSFAIGISGVAAGGPFNSRDITGTSMRLGIFPGLFAPDGTNK